MDTMQFSKPTGALTRSISTRSFSSQPVAPLNIASRPPLLPLTFGPRKTDSPLFLHPLSAFASSPSSPFSYHPLASSSQAILEANVRHLCDLVDSAVTDVMNDTDNVSERGQDWRSSAGTLCIQIPAAAESDLDMVLSPRTLDQAKSDISKVDQEIVSTMNSNLLLSLFPSPPNTTPSASISSITSSSVGPISPLVSNLSISTVSIESATSATTTTITTTTTTEGTATSRKQEQSAKRNWVIPPGLVFQSHLSKDSNDSPPSPCSSQRSSSLPSHRGCPSSLPSPTCSSVDSALSSPTSPHVLSAMEGLSQRLWAIETQMRRPSFLVNRRTSILSTLFASNAISPLMISDGGSSGTGGSDGVYCGPMRPHSPLSPTRTDLESFALTPKPVLPLQWNLECVDSSKDQDPSHSSPCSENPLELPPRVSEEDALSPTATLPCSPTATADGDVDWRAWHANWTRGRPCKASKLQKQHQQFLRQQQQDAADSLLSPLSPISPGAFSLSSEISTLCSPTFPPISSGNSTLCSRMGSFEATVNHKFWQSASVTTVVSGHSSKNNNNSNVHPVSSPLKKYQSNSTYFTPESSRPHGGNSKLSIKDANPELWEDVDGLKWKDRFQSLVHNFQTSAGKHSRRLAEILPKAKSRWVNKKSLSSSSQSLQPTPQPTPSSTKVW